MSNVPSDPNNPSAGPPQADVGALSVNDSWWSRTIRSKRVRIFFALSVLVHVLFAIAISNQRIHDWILGGDEGVKQVEATPWELKRAIDDLTKIYVQRFTESVRELIDLRARLDNLQLAKFERIKEFDKFRKDKIDKGEWPTKEKPDKTAKFIAMADTVPPRFNFAAIPDMAKLDLVALYRLHPPLEIEIGKVYERYQALDLSEHPDEPIPVSQAIKNTKLTHPKRRDIQAHLLDASRITSALGEPFKQFKQELIDAWLETQDMLNTARRWVELAESKDKGASLLVHFGAVYNLMPPPQPYFGHYLNPRLLRRATQEKLIDPACIMGNRIGQDEVTLGAEWLSIDRWFSIGPFAHPGAKRRQADLERKYPPETKVNLDAVYEGKDGRKLMWKYRHMGTDFLDKGLRFEPYTVDNESYAIWYFYTEVYSDRDQTVLGSFASDDYGVCWINDVRIYTSPPDTQPWVPFTRYGFKPVHLRKGFNKFLFKLENAQGTTAFSVILMTYEDKDLIKAVQEAP